MRTRWLPVRTTLANFLRVSLLPTRRHLVMASLYMLWFGARWFSRFPILVPIPKPPTQILNRCDFSGWHFCAKPRGNFTFGGARKPP